MFPRRLRGPLLFFSGLTLIIFSLGEACKFVVMKLDFTEPKVAELMRMRDAKHDILYLGNSLTLQGFNPRVVDEVLGTKSHNMAMGGASYITMELLLRHYLERNHRPRLVIYGVVPNRPADGHSVRPSVLHELSPQLREYSDAYLQRCSVESTWLLNLMNRVPLFHYRIAPERLLKYLIGGNARVPRHEAGHLMVSFSAAQPKTMKPHKAGITEEGLKSFVACCEEQDIDVLFVELPNWKAFNESVEGREKVMTILHEHLDGRYPFVSLNNDKELADYVASDWAGANHFNAQGAEKFSRKFASYLAGEQFLQASSSIRTRQY